MLGTGQPQPPWRDSEDDCAIDKRLLVAALHAKLFGSSEAVELDGYSVHRRLGSGAMGVVYLATDPRLRRKVALKVLRRGDEHGGGEHGDLRLQREARALGRLCHPNIIQIYDVGHSDGRLYISMEYVEGASLHQWQAAQARDWREILDAFLQAGRGLAAAHAAGVLHRDLKPSNVLVGADGRIRVVDFGLAKLPPRSFTQDRVSSRTEHDWSQNPPTLDGSVVGTPRYMAPAQLHGAPATTASDQYSLCVMLHEALFNEPPFDPDEMMATKRSAERVVVRTGRMGVPLRVQRALRRGLSPNPSTRFESVAELVRALEVAPPRPRRWLGLAGLAVLAACPVAASVGGGPKRRCNEGHTHLEGIWRDAGRNEVQEALLQTGVPYAESTWERTAPALERYAAKWTTMHRETCNATAVRGEQSARVMDLRMACLQRAKLELQSVVAVLADADANVVRNAPKLVAGLRPLSRCSDVDALQAEVEPPLAGEAVDVDAVRALLAEAKAERKAGRNTAGEAKLLAAKARAAEIQYGPLRTEIALSEGFVLEALGQYDAAENALKDALSLAMTWQQHEALHDAVLELMFVIGEQQSRTQEAMGYRTVAAAFAKGVPRREANFHQTVGNLFRAQGKYAEAETELRRSLTLRDASPEPDPQGVARAWDSLADVLNGQGRYEEASLVHRRVLAMRLELLGPGHPDVVGSRSEVGNDLFRAGEFERAAVEHRRVLAVREKALGPEHPRIATSLNSLALALAAQGQYEEAEAAYRRSLAIAEAARGPDHPDVTRTREHLAMMFAQQQDYHRAELEHRRALADREKTQGSEHPDVAACLGNLGVLLLLQNKFDEGAAYLTRALAIRERVLGPRHPHVAVSRSALGDLEYVRGNLEDAAEEQRRALSIYEETLSPEHPRVSHGQNALAKTLLELGQSQEALDLAERAWEQRRQRVDNPTDKRAGTAFVLARALWSAGPDEGQRDRAIALASTALDEFAAAGDAPEEAEEVRAWLDAR